MKWERYGYCSGKGDDCDGCNMEGCGMGNGGAYFIPKSAITTHMHFHDKLTADLAASQARVTELEAKLASKTEAFDASCRVLGNAPDRITALESKVTVLSDALRPFADAYERDKDCAHAMGARGASWDAYKQAKAVLAKSDALAALEQVADEHA